MNGLEIVYIANKAAFTFLVAVTITISFTAWTSFTIVGYAIVSIAHITLIILNAASYKRYVFAYVNFYQMSEVTVSNEISYKNIREFFVWGHIRKLDRHQS